MANILHYATTFLNTFFPFRSFFLPFSFIYNKYHRNNMRNSFSKTFFMKNYTIHWKWGRSTLRRERELKKLTIAVTGANESSSNDNNSNVNKKYFLTSIFVLLSNRLSSLSLNLFATTLFSLNKYFLRSTSLLLMVFFSVTQKTTACTFI